MVEIDPVKLRYGAAFLVTGQAMQAFVAFGVNLVLVRFLLPEDFGRFALVMAAASIVFSVLSARTDILVIRATDRQLSDRAKDLYFSILAMEMVPSCLVIALWIVFSDPSNSWNWGLVLALGVRHWSQQNRAYFERTMPYRKLALIETGAAVASHLLALGLVLGGVGWRVLYVREYFLAFSGLAGLWWVGGLTLRRLRLPSGAEWRSVFKEARGIWLDGILEGSFQRFTILLAGLLGGERLAGFFFQAQRLAIVPNQFLAPIVSRVAANWFGRTEDAGRKRAGRNRLLIGAALPLIFGGVLTLFFADPVVPWLFGAEWARSADLLAAMSGVVIFLSLFEILKAYCWSTHRIPALLLGRAGQYFGCLLPVLLFLGGWLSRDMALALGQSLAYFLAFALVLVALGRGPGDAGR